MRDAHRRVGRVDVLSARTAGAHRIDADVLVPDLDIDLLGFGQNGNGGGGGVNASLALRFRHALHAVHAGFELQTREHAAPADVRDDLLVAAHLTLGHGRDLDAPLPLGRVALIHAEQIPGEQRGFRTASARAYLDNGGAIIGLVLGQEHQLHPPFEIFETFAQFFGFRLRHLAHLRVEIGVSQHLDGTFAFASRGTILAYSSDYRRQFGVLGRQRHVSLSIRPLGHARLDLGQPRDHPVHLIERKGRHGGQSVTIEVGMQLCRSRRARNVSPLASPAPRRWGKGA